MSRFLVRPRPLVSGLMAGLLVGVIGVSRSRYTTKSNCEEKKDSSSGSTIQDWLSIDSMKSQFTSLSSRLSQISSELSGDPELDRTIGFCEKGFMRERKHVMRKALACLIGVDEREIDERDIPIVGIAASGGGYRAMTSTTGCLLGARQSGILDVVSYISGISGSCWALAGWYSVAGGNLLELSNHIKSRITKPFLDLDNFQLFTDAPTNKYLLAGPVAKLASKGGSTSLVDVYGTLVASRLYVPDDLSHLDPHHLKLSNQRHLLNGSLPLPIYCAIYHQVPDQVQHKNDLEDSESSSEKAARDQSFISPSYHWYEMTPYEVGSQDVGAFIPTWALGRAFENGRDIEARPEISLSILSGIFASAFTATLAHYYQEVKPGLVMLPFFKAFDTYVSSFESDLSTLHPFPPAELPNFLRGLHGQLEPGISAAVTERETLGFMDAGAELNIPYVPLYRRGCDIIISLDASADSQDVWFSKAQTYAQRCGLDTWPIHADHDDEIPLDKSEVPVKKSRVQAFSQLKDEDQKSTGDEANPFPAETKGAPDSGDPEPPLGRCNIWVGDSSNKEMSARMDEPNEEMIRSRDGPALIYIPLAPGNGLDDPAQVWSTWRFDYKEEETEQLLKLSEMNFRSGEKQMKARKRDKRLKKNSGS
ncbi:acyl transferase/acyl hydrolase/lysophospholipase [Melampsora americana]|nr:acyl transferase/acyl hydrolase/lysophospholipase [Melampsora americana]